MPTSMPILNYKTLRFPDTYEKKYQQRLHHQVEKVFFPLFLYLLLFLVISLLLSVIFLGQTLSDARVIFQAVGIVSTIYGLLAAFLFREQMKSSKSDIVFSSIALMFLGGMIILYARLEPTSSLIPYGIILLSISINSLLPYSFWYKISVTLFFFVGMMYVVIVNGLFPNTDVSDTVRQVFIYFLFNILISYVLEVFVRRQGGLAIALDAETEKVDKLLLNTLPSSIAKRLKDGEENIVDEAEEVTIIFADLVGFTELASKTKASKIVQILNDIFSRFDLVVKMHGAEKIKTMGDCYFAVAGIPEQCEDHAPRIAKIALEFRSALEKYSTLMDVNLSCRIGIHTGPVMAGIIGTDKFLYDLWGDTVNVASRMESHGAASKIQVSDTTRRALGDKFKFSDSKEIEIKGKGTIMTSFLLSET